MMRLSKVLASVLAVALLVSGATALAQIPTGTLSGRAINEGMGLPGVTVTAKSPALQGDRVTVTGASGAYVMANLPPGEYRVVFTISGFQTVTKNVKISAAQQNNIDAVLSLTNVVSEVTVLAGAEAISQSSVEATTYTQALMTQLPTARSINSAVALSPGLNANGPNGYSVAGAQSTENLYMVNGVMIGDNVRNTPNNLFIEDAIQETTTTTSSVSAEYGRFVGGVINTLTKSGGNQFSGSVRANLANDSWNATSGYRTATGANPQDGAFLNKITPTWEATFGGPIWKDKIWFFLAGRYYDTIGSTTGTTGYTGITFATGSKEPRYEAKLTLTPVQNHTLTGSYVNNKTTSSNLSYPNNATIMDLDSLYSRTTPQDLLAINYNGVLSDSFFLSAQYSKRKYTFENSGSTYTDAIKGTLLLDRSRGNARFNSPTFCGVCTPETRNNDDILVKGTYFLSSKDLGSHQIVAGYDNFGGQRQVNNHQSGSDWRMYTQGAVLDGSNIYPIFNNGTSTRLWFQPIPVESQGSDMRTQSGFVNDTWRLSNYFSFNVGVRYDLNHAKDANGLLTSTDSAWSPRLAASWDPKGDGKFRVTASYAKYVAAIQEGQAGSGYTPAGSPATYYWYYDGAPGATPINTAAPYVNSAQALTQVFNWLKVNGCYDPNNFMQPTTAACKIPYASAPSLPGLNVQVNGSLASPSANEYTFGIQGTVGTRGSFRADVVRRTFGDFYDQVLNTSTGRVKNASGQEFDLSLVGNSSDYRREYTGLHTQFQYRFGDHFNFGANWTWSHVIGDLVGENSTSGTLVATLHSQPEYFDRSWASPVGSLSSDQRHRVRVYGTYDVPMSGKAGNINVGLIQSWDTGTPYGAAGVINSKPYVTNPGYLSLPATVSYFFTARDAYRYEDVWRTDLSLTYSFRFANTVELYINPQVYNVFNAQHIIAVNQTVNTAANSSANYATFNPFTEVPQECPQTTTASACKAMGGNWQKGAQFGQVTGTGSYQVPRYFQIAVGLRF